MNQVVPTSARCCLDREAAMTLTVTRFRARLLSRARSIVHDEALAQDAVQEAFLRAWREPRFFDADFHQAAWLRRVLTNHCLNKSRDRRRRDEILAAHDLRPISEADQHETVVRSQESAAIAEAITHLSSEHQEVIRQRYEHDLSYREIAERLDLQLGTVMSRLSRARSVLRKLLPDEYRALNAI